MSIPAPPPPATIRYSTSIDEDLSDDIVNELLLLNL